MLLDEAGVEVQLGRMARATELLAQVKDKKSIKWALVAVKAGSTTAANAYLKQPDQYPHDTLVNKMLLPELMALQALQHNDPAAALTVLEPARPYELAMPEVIEVRAQAYLASKQPSKAAEELQKLLDHPALEDPTMPRTILAHLGLARVYAMQDRKDDSRKEYKTFFSLWKDADPDLPVLHQARLEYNQLGNATAKP
jgi:eukaryotic-like serine/threonine-protein kinase